MHYLYIIYSEKRGSYYSGQTKDVKNRLSKHNRGHSLATKNGIPWVLRKVVEFETKSEAIKAENWLKRMKSKKVIERVIRGKIDMREVIAD
ncbi:GIY-YIG nuclease family protein [Rhodohalobacter sp. 614A]|uniref:GIY-YIG nuclease family protein n=1 Tax=Rhodohalobacter sp. 614A TaxID=2908649 RepID=UPI001F280E56|nr:GIY-YIG nuclease family protein [Rhodohalobacter sp. 614A]